MGVWDDYFNSKNSVRGRVGNAVSTNGSNTNPNTSLYPANFIPNASLDEQWGGIYTGTATNNYYDYYFSGQDISVTIDGTEDDPQFAQLPIGDFSFRIDQNKQTLFGFWSYTFDAVMRGTRVVSGSFTIMTRSPNYMKQALAKAALARQTNLGSKNYSYYRNLTEDDSNIAQYWGKTMDPALQQGQVTNMFSVHPPFSLVILYGIQNISLNDTGIVPISQDLARWNSDNVLMADTNERLVEADNMNQSMRIILDDCELISMQTGFNNSGQVVCEQYEFFARDMVIPDPPS